MKNRIYLVFIAVSLIVVFLKAWKARSRGRALPPPATLADVRYGVHERQVLDFWRAESNTPTPLLFFIHGGGWAEGDKTWISKSFEVEDFLKSGISVVSINYRYVKQAMAERIEPPVMAPLQDAARALQFVRTHSKEWNLNKERIGASGVSAGGFSSLWLAFHDDLANATSEDPVARESTRLWCAAVFEAQTTLDPVQMREWTPNSSYGAHAFGIYKVVNGKPVPDFDEFLMQREKLLPWIAEYSPADLVTRDDPPVFLVYPTAPALGQPQADTAHTSNFGAKLKECCEAQGVSCDLAVPGADRLKHKDPFEFLIATLKSEK